MASTEHPKIGPLRRQYRRFMDWLWFGPLTRDLHPRRHPSTLSQVFSLLGYIWRDSWSLLWQRLERSRHGGGADIGPGLPDGLCLAPKSRL